MKFLKEADKAAVKAIDAGVKNKWSWKWQEEVLRRDIQRIGPVMYKLSDCFEKVDVAGVAYCKWCNDKVLYGGNGKKHLISHCSSDKHIKHLTLRATNYQLGGVGPPSQKSTSTPSSSQLKVFPIFKTSLSLSNKNEGSGSSASPMPAVESTPADPLIPISDRTVNTEAMILSFIAENSLPLSLSAPLANLIQEASRDPKSLNGISLSKTTSSYKMNYGLAATFGSEIVAQLRVTPFSLNIDEATSDHGKKVLSLIVSYFDEKIGELILFLFRI